MLKKRLIDLLGLLFIRIGYSWGFGIIISLIIVYFLKLMPDTVESTMIISLPFAILGLFYFSRKYCNSIETINSDQLIISNWFNKQYIYHLNNDSIIDIQVINNTIHHAHLCYTLMIKIQRENSKIVIWHFSGYPKDTLSIILDKLEEVNSGHMA